MLAICFRKESEEGPVISNKEDAMKELGIEKQYLAQVAGGVTRNVKRLNQRPKTFNIVLLQVPLSEYSERDIIEAFRKKLEKSGK